MKLSISPIWAVRGLQAVPYLDHAELKHAPKSTEEFAAVHRGGCQDSQDRISRSGLKGATSANPESLYPAITPADWIFYQEKSYLAGLIPGIPTLDLL